MESTHCLRDTYTSRNAASQSCGVNASRSLRNCKRYMQSKGMKTTLPTDHNSSCDILSARSVIVLGPLESYEEAPRLQNKPSKINVITVVIIRWLRETCTRSCLWHRYFFLITYIPINQFYMFHAELFQISSNDAYIVL